MSDQSRSDVERVVIWLRQSVCRHKFYTEQICKDYEKPVMPEGLSIAAQYKHPAHTKRMCWPCGKCGKRFYAHCGLDIVGKHGKWAAYHAPAIQPCNKRLVRLIALL